MAVSRAGVSGLHFVLCMVAVKIMVAESKLMVKDLSHTFNNGTLYWPSMISERFRFTKVIEIASPYYAAKSFYAAEHGGTHLDAPSHFVKGKLTVDQIPITSLVGKSVVIDVTSKAEKNKDLQIGKTDFEDHEKKLGRISDESIILLSTGWGKHWPNATAYFGTATNNTAILHFPGLDPAAATWLIQNRKVKAIGIDTASIDYGQSKNFTTHRILMGNNVPVFENVANLNLVPARDAMVYALPMKIGEGTGAPLRIIATWDDSKKTNSAAKSRNLTNIFMLILLAICFFSIN